MSIELVKTVTVDEPIPKRISDYKLTHHQPGGAGTVLKLGLRVTQIPRISRVEVEFTDLVVEMDGDQVEPALDKLADWMDRAAKELRARGAPVTAVAHYPNRKP